MQTCSRLYACLRQFSNNDSICYCLSHMSSTLSPVLGFFACCRLSRLTSALMPVVDFHVRPQLCRLFWALKPFVNFLACPRLCRLLSALCLSSASTILSSASPPVLGFETCNQLSCLSSTLPPDLGFDLCCGLSCMASASLKQEVHAYGTASSAYDLATWKWLY